MLPNVCFFLQVTYKKKMKVQALDPETKHWLLATIIDNKPGEGKVTWTGYSKDYDCWLTNNDIRSPVITRPMYSRNAISKKDFPNRQHPKYLQCDDVVCDTNRNSTFIVATNDPYEAKVKIHSSSILSYPSGQIQIQSQQSTYKIYVVLALSF